MSSNLKVNTILPSTGTNVAIGTAGGSVDFAGTLKVGIVTARDGQAASTAVYYGDGSNLTGIPAQATIANNADNRVITGGSGVNLNGEANLTFETSTSGGTLTIAGTSEYQLKLKDSNTSGNGAETALAFTDSGDTIQGFVGFNYWGDGNLDIQNNNSGGDVCINTGGGNERLRIESGGDVSIGGMDANTFSNYRTLTIGGAGASDGAGIDLERSDGNIYGRFFADANGIQIQAAQGGDSIRFETGGSSERLRIDSNGDLTINDGNLIVASGHGIDFSATSGSPSNGGEILDDYEEGDFTASLGGLSNWSSYSVTGTGHYVKIGKAVHININWGNVDLNNSASGRVIIFNLPFTPYIRPSDCRGVTSNYMAHKVQHANDGMIHSWYINSTYGFMGQITKNNTGWTSWDASNFTATGVYLDFSATYFTAS